MSLPLVGAQLLVFGARYNINTDTDAILDCVARAGYASVEGAANDTAMYRRKLDARGLRYAGGHVGLAALDDLAPVIEKTLALGGADLCNSALRSWDARSLDDYRDGIRVLNDAGRRLRDAGIHLHYHNHDFEFDKVDGEKTGMDLLLDGLDFDVVDLCVDVAWVTRGSLYAPDFLRTHKDKIGYLHFKDFDGTDWIELGQGIVPMADIMQVLPELTKVRWVMIEQDATKIDPMDSVTISRAYLRDTFNY